MTGIDEQRNLEEYKGFVNIRMVSDSRDRGVHSEQRIALDRLGYDMVITW